MPKLLIFGAGASRNYSQAIHGIKDLQMPLDTDFFSMFKKVVLSKSDYSDYYGYRQTEHLLDDIWDLFQNENISLIKPKRIGESPEEDIKILDDKRLSLEHIMSMFYEFPIFDDDLVVLAEDGGFFDDKTRPISYIIKGKNWVNNHAHVLRPKNGIELEYLKHILNFTDLMPFVKGSTRLKLNQGDAKRIILPIAPKNIQKKIVQKLDYVLVELEKKKKDILDLKKKLEKNFSEIPPSFKNRIESKNNLFLIIKNKIFENGFNGKLSAEYRKNKMKYEHDWFRKIETQRSSLINKNKKKTKKRDVFQILDKDDPSLSRIPSEWVWTNITSLETMVGSGSTPKGGKSNYIEKGIPFIRSQNVLFNELDLSDVVYISEEIHSKMNRTYVKANDVLLNITGASIGRASSVSTNFKNGNVNQHVCIIRTGSWMNPEYLSFWLNSPYIQNFIYDIEIGATKEGLNFEQVRTFPVPLPKIEEQDIIVKQIQKKLSELQLVKTQTTNARQFYQTSMNELGKISQSILNSAFSGKLIS